MGIEPTYPAWKAGVLPLNYTRKERDYHRKKYLESRGWNVYRLWSYNWFKNKHKELNKIIEVYNKLK